MTLKQLEYFVTIADIGSFSKAADKLHISQPPLSMQIRLLEQELKVVLFERSTRYIRLTNEGERLYERAVSILELSKAAISEAGQVMDKLEGKLIIGSISSSENLFLNEKSIKFIATNPSIRFELVEGNTISLIEKLHKRELDLTFLRTPFDPEDLECHYICSEPLCAVGIKEYFSTSANTAAGSFKGSSISLQKLESSPLIFYRRYAPLLYETFKSESLNMNIRCINDDARTSLKWAKEGLGIAIVPYSIIGKDIRSELDIRSIDHPGFETQVAVVHRKNQYLSPVCRSFLDCFL